MSPALARGGIAFTSAAHGAWWMIAGLGAGIVFLGMVSTGRRAAGTTSQAAALFTGLDLPVRHDLVRLTSHLTR